MSIKRISGVVVEGRDLPGRSYWKAYDSYVTDIPKPARSKLYCVDYKTKNRCGRRYIVALDKEHADVLFMEKYPKLVHAETNIMRVPNQWHIRWPVIWDRIGVAYAEDYRNRHYSWLVGWNKIWDGISMDYEQKFIAWMNAWIKLWFDIGNERFDSRTRFDYLEI